MMTRTNKKKSVRGRGTRKNTPSIAGNIQRLTINSNLNLSEPTMYKADASPIRVNRQAIYQIETTLQQSQITYSGSVLFYVLNFALNSLPAATQAGIQVLWGEYRVTQLTFQFQPVVFGTNPTLSTIYSVIDQNDTVALASIGAAQSYETLRTVIRGQYFERTFTPNTVVSGSGSDSYPKAYRWVTTKDLTVVHMGLKLATAQGQTGEGWNVSVRAVMQFRRVGQ